MLARATTRKSTRSKAFSRSKNTLATACPLYVHHSAQAACSHAHCSDDLPAPLQKKDRSWERSHSAPMFDQVRKARHFSSSVMAYNIGDFIDFGCTFFLKCRLV